MAASPAMRNKDRETEPPLLVSVPEAARILGIPRATTYRYVHSGDIPTRRLGGRLYVIRAGLDALGEIDSKAVA